MASRFGLNLGLNWAQYERYGRVWVSAKDDLAGVTLLSVISVIDALDRALQSSDWDTARPFIEEAKAYLTPLVTFAGRAANEISHE